MTPATTRANPADRPSRSRRPAFTLIELMVVMALIAILLGVVTMSFRSASDSAVLAQARNTITTYAKLARSYAVANEIETMLVVNPHNGRLELWHLNPPPQGGVWDPISSYDPTNPQRNDPRLAEGYAFAPVFDSGAQLPTKGGRPSVVVHPIDSYNFANQTYLRPVNSPDPQRDMDNLTWPAFCFDASGRLVARTRRIATRLVGQNIPNRLADGRLDPTLLTDLNISPVDRYLVRGGPSGDTPITSTVGFVISDASAMQSALPPNPTPRELVDGWLRETIPGGAAETFSQTIILNRYSGQELIQAS